MCASNMWGRKCTATPTFYTVLFFFSTFLCHRFPWLVTVVFRYDTHTYTHMHTNTHVHFSCDGNHNTQPASPFFSTFWSPFDNNRYSLFFFFALSLLFSLLSSLALFSVFFLMPLQKFLLVAAVMACTNGIFAAAQEPANSGSTTVATTTTTTTAKPTTTTTPVPVNLNQNIVTTVLILGVTVAVTLIYVLSQMIPKYRRGELSFSKIDFDWRAELLNQTPKKEKLRRAEEKARRDEERAPRRYGDVDESGIHNGSDTQPRVELRETDEPVAEANGSRNGGEDQDTHVTFPREHRE